MKKLWLLTSMLSIIFLASCTTLWKSVKDASPYQIGKSTTIVYLLGKEQLNENQKKSIETAYLKFEELTKIITVDNIQELKPNLDKKLEELLKDEKQYALASEFIDRVWNKLVTEHNVDKLTNLKAYNVIIEFRQGIRDALEKYDFLK